jgi:glycosyltransferase involved in cell wall biosynthesis
MPPIRRPSTRAEISMSEGHRPEGDVEPRERSANVVDLREAAGRRSFPRPRKAVLVVGMHRSGTSALTRLLSLLGADLPRELMPPAAGDNPTGYWESPRIAALHDELLASAGSSWDDVSPLPDSWFSSDAAAVYRDRLLELLERDFADSRLFVVKDPRIARLLPLWQSVLRQFSTEPRYVLIVRNPLEVAASLKVRNGFLPAKSYLLWLSHLLESERNTRRHPRAFVLFDQLLRDWHGTALRLERQLRLGWPRFSARAAVEVDEFLTDRLRHHEAGAEELAARSDAVTWVKRAYSAVLDAASGGESPLAETLDSVRVELARADAAFVPLLAQGQLQLERSEAELRTATEELDARRREIESSTAAIAARDDELAARAQEIQRLGDELAQQQTASGALNTALAQRDAELVAGREQIQRLDDELAQHQAAIDAVNTVLAQRDAELVAGREQIERLDDELAQHQAAADTLAAELAEADAESIARREEIGRLGDELATRRRREDELGMRLVHAEGVVEALRRKGREGDERLSAQRQQLELLRASQENRQREISSLEAGVRIQQLLMDLRADEIRRLRAEVEDRRAENAAVAAERARLAANMDLQSERLRELDAELRQAGATVASRDAEIARLTGEVYRQGQENERLNLTLADSSRATESLHGQLGRAGEEIAALAGALRGAEDSVRSLERQAAEEQSRIREFAQSRSWRLLRPLRWLAGSLRPRSRRLRRLRRRFEASGAAALFDDAYYRDQFASLEEVGPDPVLHYLDEGCRVGRNPHPLFDTAFYLQQCPQAAGGDAVALTHYFERGAKEGRDPHPLFRTSFYLEGLPAPLAPGENPLLHFLRRGAAEGRSPHPLFDPEFYLQSNPDLAAAQVNPLAHYVRHGGTEGRDPHPLFDAAFYLDRNPQVGRAHANPLDHYLRIGADQGCDPHPRFDSAYYRQTNPDWADTGMTPLEHYLAVGSERGSRTCAKTDRHVLIVDHKLPAPDQDAGSLRMSHLISVLQGLGWQVTFLPHNLFDMEPYTEQLRETGVEVLVRPEVDSIADYLEGHGDRYDLVIVCRVTVADDCFSVIQANCQRAKIVFDTIDLQHLRMQRQAELDGDDELRAEASRVRSRELELARHADAIWVVSPYEKKLLALEDPELNVGVVSTIHRIHGRRGGFSERRDLMFIGGFEHPPNIDAVEWLVGEILPRVHREEPELRAFLLGSKPTDRVRRLASDRVTVTGHVPDVGPYFSRCRLSVAPLRYGAGIKGKVNQSLAYGMPCVLTGIAAEGMGLEHGVDAMIADSAAEFADCILAVYRDAELWQQLSDGGLENVRRHFSFPAARTAVAEALGALDPDWAWQPRPV